MKRLVVLFGALLLLLTACGSGESEQDIPQEKEQNASQHDVGNSDELKESGNDPYEDTIATGTGKYIKLKDTNVIEVETNQGIQTFQLTKESEEDMAYIEPGQEVKYTYYKKDEKFIIDYIEESEYYDRPRRHHEHHQHHRHHRHHGPHGPHSGHHGPSSNWKE